MRIFVRKIKYETLKVRLVMIWNEFKAPNEAPNSYIKFYFIEGNGKYHQYHFVTKLGLDWIKKYTARRK